MNKPWEKFRDTSNSESNEEEVELDDMVKDEDELGDDQVTDDSIQFDFDNLEKNTGEEDESGDLDIDANENAEEIGIDDNELS